MNTSVDRHTPRLLAGAAVILMMALAAPSADATVLKDLKLADLVEQSHAIVIGEVVGQRCHRPGGDQGHIWTDTAVTVKQTLKGKAPDELVIRQQGGRVGDVVMHVAGNAQLPLGGRFVLFLVEEDGRYFTVGMELGAFLIEGDGEKATVARKTSVPVAIEAPDGGVVMAPADGTWEGARLTRLTAEVARLVAGEVER